MVQATRCELVMSDMRCSHWLDADPTCSVCNSEYDLFLAGMLPGMLSILTNVQEKPVNNIAAPPSAPVGGTAFPKATHRKLSKVSPHMHAELFYIDTCQLLCCHVRNVLDLSCSGFFIPRKDVDCAH